MKEKTSTLSAKSNPTLAHLFVHQPAYKHTENSIKTCRKQHTKIRKTAYREFPKPGDQVIDINQTQTNNLAAFQIQTQTQN
mmetsp:Transcript_29549/g.47169  ORF Transcript_29549/g.47169 Transcript_29549/m.47169 type:complete len:81 (-) Transcript_29549:483-725(-)